MSAPLTTANTTIPAFTDVVGYTSSGTFTEIQSSAYSTGVTTSYFTYYSQVTDGGPAETTETDTFYNTDNIQFLSTIRENSATITETQVLYGESTYAYSTVTNPSQSAEIYPGK